MVHCLFERSNTFRDAFLRAGYEAKLYDIVDRSRIKSEFADFFVNTFVPRPL